MSLIQIADYLGVFVFAVSGGLVAIRHNMDLLGILVISLFPAIGGSTLRDISGLGRRFGPSAFCNARYI